MDNYAFYKNNLTRSGAFPIQGIQPIQQLNIPNFDRKLSAIDEIKELKSISIEITDLDDHNPTKNTNGSQLHNVKPSSVDQNYFKGFDYDNEQINIVNRTLQQNEANQKMININHGFDH